MHEHVLPVLKGMAVALCYRRSRRRGADMSKEQVRVDLLREAPKILVVPCWETGTAKRRDEMRVSHTVVGMQEGSVARKWGATGESRERERKGERERNRETKQQKQKQTGHMTPIYLRAGKDTRPLSVIGRVPPNAKSICVDLCR